MDNVHEAVKDGHEAPDALREAFDAVRWWKRGGKLYCNGCGREMKSPEKHAPGCPVGKVMSGEK